MARGRPYRFAEALELSAFLVCLLYAILAVNLVFHLGLSRFGIVPRTGFGLLGIVFSPLLHAGWGHLMANAIPLFILLVLLFADRHYYPARTLALIWIGSGLGTWIIGRGGSVHIGSSSIIFGLVVYLMVAGILMKSWRSALIALIVFFAFGTMLLGVLPHSGPISWEGHLCGAAAGFWAARHNHE
jgi:membrane associated rhomboid family serine protease